MKNQQILELLKLANEESEDTNQSPWQLGKNYFIRTATYHVTGKLLGVYEHELELESACWIADSGRRFADALKTCDLAETEPFPDKAIIGRGAIIDACVISEIPRHQK